MFASLSPQLLARKGGAKPAMRPQVQPLDEFQMEEPHLSQDDLGWNDMGGEGDIMGGQAPAKAEIVPINGTNRAAGRAKTPVIVTRQKDLAGRIKSRAAAKIQPRDHRAAFTLRIDPERHLQLRLASSVTGRSAQAMLTEALSRMLDEMPQIQSLAEKTRKRS